MDFLILTKNEFFRLINDGADARTITPSVYNEFIKEVCTVCCAPPSQRHHLIFTLAYIEKELGCLHEIHKAESSHTIPIRKALTFVRRMFRYLQTQTPPLSAQKSDIPDTPFRWTGSLVELVEIIYAFDENGRGGNLTDKRENIRRSSVNLCIFVVKSFGNNEKRRYYRFIYP